MLRLARVASFGHFPLQVWASGTPMTLLRGVGPDPDPDPNPDSYAGPKVPRSRKPRPPPS